MGGPADDRLVNILGALALGIGDALRDATEAAAGQTGAGPAAVVVLDDLLADSTVDRLRRSVALTASGGVRLVDRLVADGLVVRRPGADGRSLSLALTPDGQALAAQVRTARADTLQAVLGALSAEERRQLGGLVEKMIGGLVADRLAGRADGIEPGGGWLCRLCDAGACGRPAGTCPAATAARSYSAD